MRASRPAAFPSRPKPFRLRRTGALGAVLAVALTLLVGPAARAGDVPAPGLSPIPAGGPQLSTTGLAVNLAPALPAPPRPRSSSYVVADLDTGQVLAARDPHGRFAPASTLKILTALTFIPRFDPDTSVEATYADAVVDGTRVGLVPGMHYRMHDLFTAMLVMSANDAARAVQTAVGGKTKTLRLMNGEAARIQANDTHAESPHGLDRPGQYSSAYDLALLSRAALQLRDFRKYVATIRANFPAPHGKHYEIYTHDHLLLNYKGAFGVKNGYTVAAQASFVGAAQRHGHRLVVAVMHANPLAWMDVMQLLTWGFAVDGRISPVGSLVDPLPDSTDGVTPTPAPAATIASAVLPTSHNGPAIPTAPVVVAILIVVGFVVLRLRSRSRRRRWRYRSRYSLPKL